MCFCVLVAVYANTYAPLHYDPPRGNCWEHVRNKVFALSEEIRFEDIRVLDGLVANRLIQSNKHIMEISEKREDWKPKDSTWLLTKVLPWSGNSGYTKFCCMLHAKSKLPELGRNVCNKCHQWNNHECETNNSVQFVFDKSCWSVLLTFRQSKFDVDMPIAWKFLNDLDLDFSSVVSNASMVCTNQKIMVSLELNIDEKYILKKMFQENIARHLGVKFSEIEVVYSRRNSTLILLRLSPRAGLQLFITMHARKLRDQFGKMMAKAMRGDSLANVSIQVKISDVPPSTLYVAPTEPWLMSYYMWTLLEGENINTKVLRIN